MIRSRPHGRCLAEEPHERPRFRSAAPCTSATGTGDTVTDGSYPKKIATERVRALLTTLDDPGFTHPKLSREPFRVHAEKWFAAQPVMASMGRSAQTALPAPDTPG
ncbi:MAG: hypothetical protein JWM02_324 [Frankiales bacterium]|nr:hypothetical protein [Frankiales bacterium]